MKRAIILAGGRGTRLRPYKTVSLLRPLMPIVDHPSKMPIFAPSQLLVGECRGTIMFFPVNPREQFDPRPPSFIWGAILFPAYVKWFAKPM